MKNTKINSSINSVKNTITRAHNACVDPKTGKLDSQKCADLVNKGAKSALKTTKNTVKKTVSAIKSSKSAKKPAFLEDILYDIQQIKERDPAALNSLEVALLYSGFHAVLAHRIAHKLHQKDMPMLARAVSQYAKHLTGIEIHPGATIGRGLFIDHGTGVVIGETTVIGDNCTIYQGATLGGTGKHTGKRHPTLGNNVMVGAGAKVLGPFKVGDNTKIAAGAVVLEELPENCTAVGIPAKVVICDGKRIEQDLDQVHIPDPVAQEIARLQARIEALEAGQNEKI